MVASSVWIWDCLKECGPTALLVERTDRFALAEEFAMFLSSNYDASRRMAQDVNV